LMRRDAALSKSLRVRLFWLGRPVLSTSFLLALMRRLQILLQLLDDGSEIEPHVLAFDLASLGELDHV